MSIPALTPPQDITWTRLAFSRDLIDTDFGDKRFPPKWRSSLAVYHYIVPEEETADAYPNSRIVYLKLTCSITGWNPSEALLNAKQAANESGALDDLQRTFWEVIAASGWASKYWPCLGAIAQIGVYPNNAQGVSPDDYPYVLDFEPKKRELFEAVTEGSEYLSGTVDKTSVTKGSTSVSSMEYGGSAGFSIGPIGASGSVSRTTSDTTINENTTDTSREARETLSRTTSSSQMYQLFNGYHLGTNRALFVVAPRPHTVSGASQTEFNLIDGERKLEGVQDVFLVVHMPRSLDGFCIQASLDTGHQATGDVPYALMTKKTDDHGQPDNTPQPPDPPPEDPPPDAPVRQLVITRRMAQACGTFDQNGNFQPRKLIEKWPVPWIIGEIAVEDRATTALLRSSREEDGRLARVEAANSLNALQARISRLILDNVSSGTYEPRAFEETHTFRSLATQTAREEDIPIQALVRRGHLSEEQAERLGRVQVSTLGDLFNVRREERVEGESDLRARVIDRLLGTPDR